MILPLFLHLFFILHWFNICDSVIDVSWDFNSGLEGWTSDSSIIQTQVINGELRGSIFTSNNQYINSPDLFLGITDAHYCIIRMHYLGKSTQASLLLQSGPDHKLDAKYEESSSLWIDHFTTTSSSTSLPLSNTSISNIIDNNEHTYYLTNFTQKAGVTIKFNLQYNRYVSSFTILPLEGNQSPKRCILQKSLTHSDGPYTTVTSFTISYSNLTNHVPVPVPFVINSINQFGQYWQLVILDTYGGNEVGIREVSFNGYNNRITVLPFTLNNIGDYQIYYIPIYTKLSGPLVKMRVFIHQPLNFSPLIHAREQFSIDYIRIVKRPYIWRIRGCLDIYYNNANYINPIYNITSHINIVNDNLPVYFYTQNYYTTVEELVPIWYTKTTDCPLSGGIDLTIDGIDMGYKPKILIGARICAYKSQVYVSAGSRVSTVRCTLPPMEQGGAKVVRVEDAVHPGLYYESAILTYRLPPPQPAPLVVEYIRATAVDVCWVPPGAIDTEVSQLVVTGYKIVWLEVRNNMTLITPYSSSEVYNTGTSVQSMTVGNISCTTIRGLKPSTEYIIAISAAAEGSGYDQVANLPTDLYGRRAHLSSAAYSVYSNWTSVIRTSAYDVYYNALLPSSDPTLSILNNFSSTNNNSSISRNTTHSANDNSTLPTIITSPLYEMSGQQTSTMTLLGSAHLTTITSDSPYTCTNTSFSSSPLTDCGPVLRLADSSSQQAGAAWYPLKVNVNEGFDTQFSFILSSPSTVCDRMNDVNTFCRSRGGDGLAFVIHNDNRHPTIGLSGMGLGYEGIANGLAVEVDTYMNYESLDVYENHIAVLTQV